MRRSVSSTPSGVRRSAPPTLHPLISTHAGRDGRRSAATFASSAFSVMTADSGITSPPKSWPRRASSRWPMPDWPDSLDGRADARWPVAVGEATDHPLHEAPPCQVPPVARIPASVIFPDAPTRSSATGKSLAGSATRSATRPAITSSSTSPQSPARHPWSSAGRAIVRTPLQMPADHLLEIGHVGDDRARDPVLAQHCASAADIRLATVETPGGSSYRRGQLGE